MRRTEYVEITTVTCDHCRKIIPDGAHRCSIKYSSTNNKSAEIDLCQECEKKFSKFVTKWGKDTLMDEADKAKTKKEEIVKVQKREEHVLPTWNKTFKDCLSTFDFEEGDIQRGLPYLLKGYLKEEGYSQCDLSKLTGVPQPVISVILSGSRTFLRRNTIIRFNKYFH